MLDGSLLESRHVLDLEGRYSLNNIRSGTKQPAQDTPAGSPLRDPVFRARVGCGCSDPRLELEDVRPLRGARRAAEQQEQAGRPRR